MKLKPGMAVTVNLNGEELRSRVVATSISSDGKETICILAPLIAIGSHADTWEWPNEMNTTVSNWR